MEPQEYREQLARDVAAWRREGLIDDVQERAILARSGAGAASVVRALRLGWFATGVSLAGAIVLAAGIVLLFAANWDDMPSRFRTSAVLAGMLSAYGAGYVLIYRFDMRRVGSAMLLVGVLLYEAGLFLLADIYSLPADGPALWLLAAAGALPLAYLFGSRIVLLLAIADFVAWVTAELVARYPDSPKIESALLVVGTLGVALYAVGRLHALRTSLARFGDTYAFSGLLVLLALVYVFTFDQNWSEMIDAGVSSYSAPVVVYVAIGITSALVAVEWLLRPRDDEARLDVLAQAALLAIAAVVATWPGWTGYAIVFDGIFFAIAAGLVTRGYLRGDERYINLGMLATAVLLLTRYVDVFWTMLAGSAFFIVGGLLLLAVSFVLERLRREIVRAMMSQADEPPQPSPGGPGTKGALA